MIRMRPGVTTDSVGQRQSDSNPPANPWRSTHRPTQELKDLVGGFIGPGKVDGFFSTGETTIEDGKLVVTAVSPYYLPQGTIIPEGGRSGQFEHQLIVRETFENRGGQWVSAGTVVSDQAYITQAWGNVATYTAGADRCNFERKPGSIRAPVNGGQPIDTFE